MRPAHRKDTNEITIAHARSQLALLLAGATDERIAGLTVDQLARINRTPRREIECRLLAEQDKRRRANARN